MKKFSKEELETLSYRDIAFYLLEDKQQTTKDLFEEICKLHGLTNQNYEEKIGDFYTSLTTDQRFIFLDSGKWDLRQNHTLSIVLDEEDEDDSDLEMSEENNEVEEDIEEDEEDIDATESDDYTEDELKDLYVLDEEELEE